MYQNRFLLHCALPWVRDLVTRGDRRNRGKLQASQYTAANFAILMGHLSFHVHAATGEKLDTVTCRPVARERIGKQARNKYATTTG
jgi:hypothetical protein